MQKQIKKLRRASIIGLYTSMAIVAATIGFNYFSHWRVSGISQSMRNSLLISGTVLAVLVTAIALLTIHRYTPKIRQLDNTQEKLRLYSANIARMYYAVLAVVAIECLFVILSANSVLIMVTLLLVMMLFLAYPNMYKIKVDLGLDDDTMKQLFGDKYISEQKNWDERPIACVELGKDAPEYEDEENVEDTNGENTDTSNQ